MFSRIIRLLFVFACIITGALWARYIVDEYVEHAIARHLAESTKSVPRYLDSIGRAKPAPETVTDAESGGPLETSAPSVEDAEADSHEPSLARSRSEILRFVDENVFPQQLIPFIMFLGGVVGLVVAILIMFSLKFVTQEAFERFFPALVSVLLAMATGLFLAWYVVQILGVQDLTLQIYIQATLVIIFFFIGVNLGLNRASRWESLVRAVNRKTYEGRYPKVMDTSVIIDGRIVDICKAGFVEGMVIVPRFVLHELQSIADSSDPLRRARGRRGLDVLKQLQAPESGTMIDVVEDEPKDVHTVDAKLVAFAKEIGAKVITNDQNLLKVAQIEGVSVMNIHDLANALKTIVLPDEEMQVRIVREGKEPQQGVGFLDDGTMVVVDGGRDHVGKSVVAIVTSVLQTSNGRMIFTKLQSAST